MNSNKKYVDVFDTFKPFDRKVRSLFSLIKLITEATPMKMILLTTLIVKNVFILQNKI